MPRRKEQLEAEEGHAHDQHELDQVAARVRVLAHRRSRDGIMAAGVERVAPGDTPEPHPRTSEQAIALDRLQSVLGTRGCVPASRRHPGRRDLISANHGGPEPGRDLRETSDKSPWSSVTSPFHETPAARALTNKTTSISEISCLNVARAARARRFCLFLRAWHPKDRDVATPTWPLPGNQ